jgi:signal transduction histidine kinase
MDLETLSNVRVLLVDDDEDDYVIIKKIFQDIPNSPFILSWTASFEEAKKLIDQRAHDIYLIDYRLGEHTGLDVLRFAKPEKRAEPFILLTGAGNQSLEWRSLKLAASDYLVKGSFNANLLSRTLYYALQRKKIEQQRLEHLIELNRTKDEFISIASHQLRTPATGVKQYLGMVIDGFAGDLSPSQEQLLAKAYESNERQLQIVSDLLKVAQLDAGQLTLKKSETSIGSLLSDIIREQQKMFESRNQRVLYDPSTSDRLISIDKDSIRMVFENIIENASKYSEEGKTIWVRVEDSGEGVTTSIKDEGVGIDSTSRSRLFEKFSRLDNALSTKVGGTGLGLYWAKKIVDLHGGTIKQTKNKPQGSIFTVYLPE